MQKYSKLQAERLILVGNMTKYGGHFVVALALAIVRSDEENYRRIKGAFPELWEKYLEINCHSDSNMKEDHNG